MNIISDLISKKKENAKPNEINKLNLIEDLMCDSSPFSKIDMKLAIDILYFLGIEENQLLETYNNLIKNESLENTNENQYNTISDKY